MGLRCDERLTEESDPARGLVAGRGAGRDVGLELARGLDLKERGAGTGSRRSRGITVLGFLAAGGWGLSGLGARGWMRAGGGAAKVLKM